MPLGTVAPRRLKRSGSRRNSTISCSSAFASSAPATSDHWIEESLSGAISCGLVRGISFIVRQMKKTSSAMKTSGAQLRIWLSIGYHAKASMLMRAVLPPNQGFGVGSRPHWTDLLGEGEGGRAAGDPAAEQAAAEERALERLVAVHAAAAEAGHLAGGVDA